MKKQNLLLTFFLLIFINLSAQDLITYAEVSEPELTPLTSTPKTESSEAEKAAMLEELTHFISFLSTEIEYPELSKKYCVEGTMLIQLKFDGTLKEASILQSLNADCDQLVLTKINEYLGARNPKDYYKISELSVQVPIVFSMSKP